MVPNYNFESCGKRAFSVIATTLWNNLPDRIRTAACLSHLNTVEPLGTDTSRLRTVSNVETKYSYIFFLKKPL